jgi:hypothetical protein
VALPGMNVTSPNVRQSEHIGCFQAGGVCQTKVVPEFCTCGAQLPPDARFCHKCGKPQYDYPAIETEADPPAPPPVPSAAPSALPPLEISFHNRLAVRIGFLAALVAVLPFMLLLPVPFLPSVVAFLTGFLAVFIYSRLTGQALSIRSGARMGWITGIFSFTFATAFFTITMVAISSQGKIADFFREHQDQLHLRTDQLSAMTKLLEDPAGLIGLIVVTLVMLFILLTALPMLGGALGAKVLEK